MAAASRNASTAIVVNPLLRPEAAAFEDLRQMLEDEPFRFHFFQAVRLLQRMQPERGPVGYYSSPQGETLRFTARTTLGFPPSELHELRRDENGQLTMMVEFMGLCAAISVLPLVYTEYLLERNREKDFAMQDFFNIFNHPNFALPTNVITPGINPDGTVNPNAGPAGLITQTPDVAQGNPGLGGGGPRVVQFGLRLQF